MYNISEYGRMIADPIRMDTYLRALQPVVHPGAIVVDIGTGFGIFALLACRFGAGRVYAIEPSNAIQVAREIAVCNHLDDRIEFIQNFSTRVNLPERADVIVSDLRGVLPPYGRHIPAIVDARQRFLAPGGVLIPRRDTLWAAVVEDTDLYQRHTQPWGDNDYGFYLQAARRIVTNTWGKARVPPEQLLTDARCWAVLDYTSVESPDVGGDVSWTAGRRGTAHGIVVWFDAVLAERIEFSNAPTAPELIYGSAFFPFEEPVALEAGDAVSVLLQANLVGDEYIWGWETRVVDPHRPDQLKAHFRQSTFAGAPLSRERLRKQSAGYQPFLNEEGQIAQAILALMDGGRGPALGEIAARVQEQFPEQFPARQDALTRVGELSQRYSR